MKCQFCKGEIGDSDHRRPGKFEGSPCPAHAERLYQVSLDGGCDEENGDASEFGLWFGRIGKQILTEDRNGFVSFLDYDTIEEARTEFAAQEKEYFAYQER